MLKTNIKVGNTVLHVELEPSTTIFEIAEFLQCEGYIEKDQSTAIQFQGILFTRGTDTIEQIVGNSTDVDIKILVNDEITQLFTRHCIDTEYRQSMVDFMPNLQQANTINQNSDTKFNENYTIDNYPSTQQNTTCTLIFTDQQTLYSTTIQIAQDKTMLQALQQLSTLIGIPLYSIIVFNQYNNQLQNHELNQFVSVFEYGNGYQFTYQINIEIHIMNFEVLNGTNKQKLAIKVNINQSMNIIIQELMIYLGFNYQQTWIDCFVEGYHINPQYLQHTLKQLQLINFTIQLQVRGC